MYSDTLNMIVKQVLLADRLQGLQVGIVHRLVCAVLLLICLSYYHITVQL